MLILSQCLIRTLRLVFKVWKRAWLLCCKKGQEGWKVEEMKAWSSPSQLGGSLISMNVALCFSKLIPKEGDQINGKEHSACL